MLVPYSKIIGSRIVELKTQTEIGEVFELIIQKNDISIAGIIPKSQSVWPKNTFVISSNDITEITSGVAIVNDEDSIVPIDEAVRLKKQIKEGYLGVGQKIYTKSGKYIGKVFDYIVNGETLTITKFYAKYFFVEKIIPFSSIISIKKNIIIIKDDFEFVKIASPAIETSII